MLNFNRLLVIASFALLMPVNLLAAETNEVWVSDGGSFSVSYTSKLEPIQINQIHQWVLHIAAEGGEAVGDAIIKLEGGMPLHDHGLPTSPIATEYLGDGNYLVEGMRFHMMGDWEITVEITQGNLLETVLITLRI